MSTIISVSLLPSYIGKPLYLIVPLYRLWCKGEHLCKSPPYIRTPSIPPYIRVNRVHPYSADSGGKGLVLGSGGPSCFLHWGREVSSYTSVHTVWLVCALFPTRGSSPPASPKQATPALPCSPRSPPTSQFGNLESEKQAMSSTTRPMSRESL